ncbi:MAG: glycosyltransferase, partial [Chloroflexota bacterium]
MLIIETLYIISALALTLYGLNSLVLTWLYRRQVIKENRDATPDQPPSLDAYPYVTIQLPLYNERHVVKRLIETVLQIQWPAERLQIQILDDSTDDTSHTIATILEEYQRLGCPISIDHVRRPTREGFKAGALKYGLASAKGEFIAIFDADFLPPPTFLQQTMPYFVDPIVGCVQTRWGHINPNMSLLTRAQALGIDGHFVIEQTIRDRIGAFLNFNGTAGVWRKACMLSAGNWQDDTLTEDLDLSYRAQLLGWRILYRPNLVAPAELPVQIQAFKRQQFRWAKGSIQTSIKLLGNLWRARQPLWRKILGTLHLTNYGAHPFMLLNLLTTLPIILSDTFFLYLSPLFT